LLVIIMIVSIDSQAGSVIDSGRVGTSSGGVDPDDISHDGVARPFLITHFT
jgi:hypothetical protein